MRSDSYPDSRQSWPNWSTLTSIFMQVVNSKESMDDDDDLAGCDCSWPWLTDMWTAPVCHLSPRTAPVYSHQVSPIWWLKLVVTETGTKIEQQQYGNWNYSHKSSLIMHLQWGLHHWISYNNWQVVCSCQFSDLCNEMIRELFVLWALQKKALSLLTYWEALGVLIHRLMQSQRELDAIVFFLHIMYLAMDSTKHSSFYLGHGHQPRLPIEFTMMCPGVSEPDDGLQQTILQFNIKVFNSNV